MNDFGLKLLTIGITGFLIGCQGPSIKISQPDPPETAQIREIGDSIAVKLMNSLKKELKAAIVEGGFQNAIDVCKLKAIPLTELVKENHNWNLEIKRTSYKYRNPLNAPDSIERIALDYFTQIHQMDKEIPEYYIQKITENNVSWFCYYKPIMVEQLCLGCHGQTANMDQAIINQLAKLYPEDKGVGYSEGEFRGLISVKIRE